MAVEIIDAALILLCCGIFGLSAIVSVYLHNKGLNYREDVRKERDELRYASYRSSNCYGSTASQDDSGLSQLMAFLPMIQSMVSKPAGQDVVQQALQNPELKKTLQGLLSDKNGKI